MSSQVVLAISMVVSSILEARLSSGVLPRATLTPSPGSSTWATSVAVSGTATPSSAATVSRPVPLFVASGIDYLSILLFVGEQMRAVGKGVWGEFPPMGHF
jgi:hypothetical protein